MAAFKANTKGQNHSICKTGICSVVQRRRRRLCRRCRRFCLAFHTFSVYLSRIEEPLETPPPPPPKIGKIKRPVQESTYASPPSMLMQLAAFSPDLLNATTTTSISSVETPQSQVMFLCVFTYIPHCGNYRNFSVTQILREIKVSDSRVSQSAILTL